MGTKNSQTSTEVARMCSFPKNKSILLRFSFVMRWKNVLECGLRAQIITGLISQLCSNWRYSTQNQNLYPKYKMFAYSKYVVKVSVICVLVNLYNRTQYGKLYNILQTLYLNIIALLSRRRQLALLIVRFVNIVFCRPVLMSCKYYSNLHIFILWVMV